MLKGWDCPKPPKTNKGGIRNIRDIECSKIFAERIGELFEKIHLNTIATFNNIERKDPAPFPTPRNISLHTRVMAPSPLPLSDPGIL